MPTDEERREVAAKLRGKYRERMTPGYLEVQDMGLQALDYLKDLEDCLPDGDSLFTVLADLIEPKWKIAPVLEDETLVCPNCGYDLDGYGFNFCPGCGREIEYAD